MPMAVSFFLGVLDHEIPGYHGSLVRCCFLGCSPSCLLFSYQLADHRGGKLVSIDPLSVCHLCLLHADAPTITFEFQLGRGIFVTVRRCKIDHAHSSSRRSAGSPRPLSASPRLDFGVSPNCASRFERPLSTASLHTLAAPHSDHSNESPQNGNT